MSLIQHWKLDDNAASTTVVATVGTNGTLSGGDNTNTKSTTGPGGSITSAFDLNGTDDAVDISAAAISLGNAQPSSFGIWAKFDASSGMMIGRTDLNQSRIQKTTDTNILVRPGNVTINFTVPSLGTTDWHFILVTRNSSNMFRVFVDGTESSSGAQGPQTTIWAPTHVGVSQTTFFDGKIAWVKVFDSDESANAATLYAEGTGGGGGNRRRRMIICGAAA